ncbi:EF-hand domain-containing protein [Acidovorax sp. BL-A-41-H1]|uniref:EF-hand domain-containing protein n=1 Tax=Acidovorax sp. BL-A-41-H1 TaxID=3421102 RepID=UPI003F7A606B
MPRFLFYPMVLWAAALLVPAWAQTSGPEPAQPPEYSSSPSKGEVKAMRDFRMLDINGDGRLSRSEVLLFPRLSAAFDDADTNHDQYVSYEEVRAFAAKYRAERERSKAAAHNPDSAVQ